MMIFMGVLFYKVASGLCLYFIASSLWGLAERKFSAEDRGGRSGAADEPSDGPEKKRWPVVVFRRGREATPAAAEEPRQEVTWTPTGRNFKVPLSLRERDGVRGISENG